MLPITTVYDGHMDINSYTYRPVDEFYDLKSRTDTRVIPTYTHFQSLTDHIYDF